MTGFRNAAATLGGGLLVLALAGCTAANASTGPAAPSSSLPVIPHTIAPPTTPEPTPSASGATPVPVDCATVLPKAVLADLGKGFTRIKGFTPASDDDATKIVALGGTACGWQSPTTGNTLEIAVGRPSAKDADALKDDLVQRSHSVPTYGEEGYFTSVEGFGTADAFPGPYWIYARSDAFFEPGDASSVIQAVGSALTAG